MCKKISTGFVFPVEVKPPPLHSPLVLFCPQAFFRPLKKTLSISNLQECAFAEGKPSSCSCLGLLVQYQHSQGIKRCQKAGFQSKLDCFSSHDLQHPALTCPAMSSPAVCCCRVRPHRAGFSSELFSSWAGASCDALRAPGGAQGWEVMLPEHTPLIRAAESPC